MPFDLESLRTPDLQGFNHIYIEDLLNGTLDDEKILKEIPQVLNVALRGYTRLFTSKDAHKVDEDIIRDFDIAYTQRLVERGIGIKPELDGIRFTENLYNSAIRKIQNWTRNKKGKSGWDTFWPKVHNVGAEDVVGVQINIGKDQKSNIDDLTKTAALNLLDLGNVINRFYRNRPFPITAVYEIFNPNDEELTVWMTTGLKSGNDKHYTISELFLEDERQPYCLSMLQGLVSQPYPYLVKQFPLKVWNNEYSRWPLSLIKKDTKLKIVEAPDLTKYDIEIVKTDSSENKQVNAVGN